MGLGNLPFTHLLTTAGVPHLPWLADFDGELSDPSDEDDLVASPARSPAVLWQVIWDALSPPFGVSTSKLCRALRDGGHLTDSANLRSALSHPAFRFYKPTIAGLRSTVYVCRSASWAVDSVADSTPPLPPTERLEAAAAQRRHLDAAAALNAASQGYFHASRDPLPLPSVAPVSAFSHRRYDRAPDGELMATPFTPTNVPLVTVEPPPPLDLPHKEASTLEEVLTLKAARKVRRYWKHSQRMWKLAEQGNARAAISARPRDLALQHDISTRESYRGVPMDLSSHPFTTLQPSRWPDRPPPGQLRIANIRRDFRFYPAFPDMELRALCSHGGAPASCSLDTYLAGPHNKALEHFGKWWELTDRERTRGWSSGPFPETFLGTWPARVNPSNIVFRKGKGRRTDNMSWPLAPVGSIGSVNSSHLHTSQLVYVRLCHLCSAAATMLVAEVELSLVSLDLSSAFKRFGENRGGHWQRGVLTPLGMQQNEVTCFGQANGPEVFSRHSGHIGYVIKREWEYAAVCYPPTCPKLLSYLSLRRALAQQSGGDALAATVLAYLIVFIDDFGAVIFNDLLSRPDRSPVLLADGTQRKRASLFFEIMRSVVVRFGHESADDKEMPPPRKQLLLLGGTIDLETETLRLDREKRVDYCRFASELLDEQVVSFAAFTSLAFRLLVVCECKPEARQWLNSLFDLLRRHRGGSRMINLCNEHLACADVRRFIACLSSSQAIEVPLACRTHFPFASQPCCLAKFDDASGKPDRARGEDHVAGFGSAMVRGTHCFVIYGVWEPLEAELLHITVLEAVTSAMSLPPFVAAAPEATHAIEFTDNTGAEWSFRKETPHAPLLRMITSDRAAFLHKSGKFSRVERVISSSNSWADDLSRGRISKVFLEAEQLGLTVSRLNPCPSLRDTSRLCALAAQLRSL